MVEASPQINREGASNVIERGVGGARASTKTVHTSYIMLAAALGVQTAIGLSVLADFPVIARIAIGAILVSLPILASGVVFGVSLARTGP